MKEKRHRDPRRSAIFGVVPAIVTNNKDPDGQYRVRVRFPFMPNGAAERGEESTWARVATIGAGKDRGTFCLPEVGDEVLVAFEHGDIGAPFVLGGLWNGESTTYTDNKKGPNDVRGLKSRSGHQIEIVDDAKNKAERVTVTSQGGAQLQLLDANGKLELLVRDQAGQNVIRIDPTGKKVEIVAAEGSVFLSAKGALVLDADTIHFKLARSVDWNASGNVKARAGSKAALRGNQGGIEAAGALTIKGGPKVDINPGGAAASGGGGGGGGGNTVGTRSSGPGASTAAKGGVQTSGGASSGAASGAGAAAGAAGAATATKGAQPAATRASRPLDEPLKARIWIRLDLDPDESCGDQFVFKSSDGSYAQTKSAADDRVASDDSIDLEFTEAPIDQSYSLQVIPHAGAPYFVFENVPYLELSSPGTASADSPAARSTADDPLPEEVSGL